jgi:cytochrome P450
VNGPPRDAIAAVTHPDPYPYYRDLVARTPVYRDEALGLWVVASATAVRAALTSELCRVRPPAEPVPRALVGSAAGEIFAGLVRMNDGAVHAALKPRVSAMLAGFDPRAVVEHARHHARALADPARLGDFVARLPAYVVASLLGVPDDLLEATARSTGALARCFAPGATADQLEAGKDAAAALRRLFSGDDAAVANRVGFLFQSYDATAGLIGNTLVALGRDPNLPRGAELGAVVAEVVRFDPPVQNTRRFLAADGLVAGVAMKAGDAILVILAAANHDASANPHPERFDAYRRDRAAFTFGAGPHACPGEALATAIARAGAEALLAAGARPEQILEGLTYRPSSNTRVPAFPSS